MEHRGSTQVPVNLPLINRALIILNPISNVNILLPDIITRINYGL